MQPIHKLSSLLKLSFSKTSHELKTHFDTNFYISTYPEVTTSGLDPIEHYLAKGWLAGFNPRSDFDTLYYRASNPDVEKAKINPFVHYLLHGRKEGRSSQPPVDERDRRLPLDSLINCVRPTRENFAEDDYLDANPDVKAAVLAGMCVSGRVHFEQTGWREGRSIRSVNVMKMRRELVARHMDVGGKAVLEIGAFDRPLYKGHEVELRVLDYLNTDDLIALARQSEGRDPDNIAPVNYIAKSHLVSQDVDRSFDLVVCNYVIEHIPNLIEWMCDIHKLIKPGGRLLFSLPDRNYTFDYLRRETTAVDLLRAYSESHGKPDFWQILDSIYYYRPVTGVGGWYPEVLQQRLQIKTLTLMEALTVAQSQSALPYKDTHCSVFTRDSFIALFAELKAAGLLPFNLDEVTEVERGTFEFQGILSVDENFAGLPPEVQGLKPSVSGCLPNNASQC